MNAHLSVATWRRRAACRGVDPEVFYPVTDEDAGTAKSICATCPVREACLEHALSAREREGSGEAPPRGSVAGSCASAESPPDGSAAQACADRPA